MYINYIIDPYTIKDFIKIVQENRGHDRAIIAINLIYLRSDEVKLLLPKKLIRINVEGESIDEITSIIANTILNLYVKYINVEDRASIKNFMFAAIMHELTQENTTTSFTVDEDSLKEVIETSISYIDKKISKRAIFKDHIWYGLEELQGFDVEDFSLPKFRDRFSIIYSSSNDILKIMTIGKKDD